MTSIELRYARLVLALGGLLACGQPSPRPTLSAADRSVASGVSKMEAGHPTEALVDLDRAIQLDPGSIGAHRHRAHCHVMLGEHPEALQDLDRALAFGATDAWTHYARGISLRETGDSIGAIESFTRALAIDPGHFKSAQHRASTFLALDRYEEAVADLELALRITPAGDPDLEWVRGSLEQARAAAEERNK